MTMLDPHGLLFFLPIVIFLGPYFIPQFLPFRLRVGAVAAAVLALIFLFGPARALARPYNALAVSGLVVVSVAICVGSAMRTWGPTNKIEPNREYWRWSIINGLILGYIVTFMAAMSTDSLSSS